MSSAATEGNLHPLRDLSCHPSLAKAALSIAERPLPKSAIFDEFGQHFQANFASIINSLL
jgi:hypothetical protein